MVRNFHLQKESLYILMHLLIELTFFLNACFKQDLRLSHAYYNTGFHETAIVKQWWAYSEHKWATTDGHQQVIWILNIRWSLNKFPDFFRMGNFIDSTHMKL